MPIVDPNLVFLVLLGGMWLAVTAVYVPGTAVLEVVAAGVVGVALLLLTALPTNWFAVLLVIVGTVVFTVIPFINQRLRALPIVGLALQMVGALLLFSTNGVWPPLILGIGVLSLLYHQFGLMPALNTQHGRPSMLDDEPIIGAAGWANTRIAPVGTVRLRGETWTARLESVDAQPIDAGEPVLVTGQEGLTLYVVRDTSKPKRQAAEQPLAAAESGSVRIDADGELAT
jgi:membrane-bound ClpP family serine protease